MTKCQHCDADILSTSQPNRMGTTPEMQKMYDQFGALTDEIIDLSLSEFFDVSPRSDWTGAQRVAMRKAIQTATPDGDDVLRDALGQIAGKNDLSGVPDDDLENAARNALYECELIALAALAATPAFEINPFANEPPYTPAVGGEVTNAMLNAAAIEWTRMCHGYPYSNEGVKWSEFFGRMFKAAIAAQPVSPLRGRESIARALWLVEYPNYPTLFEKIVARGYQGDTSETQSMIDKTLKRADAVLAPPASPPEQPALRRKEWDHPTPSGLVADKNSSSGFRIGPASPPEQAAADPETKP